MFHTTFVQIGVFDWLLGLQKGSILVKMFKNLLLRNHKGDEAETWHTYRRTSISRIPREWGKHFEFSEVRDSEL